MLRTFCTSAGVSGASVSRSLLIETARDPHHPRTARAFWRNHVFFAPSTVLLRDFSREQGGIECSGRQHHGDEPSVLDDINTPQSGDVLEKAAEIVLCIAG